MTTRPSENAQPYRDFVRLRVKQIRERVCFTQENLANETGLGRVTISDIERGRVSLSVSDLLLIARALDTPIVQFLPCYPDARVLRPTSDLSLYAGVLTWRDSLC